MFGGAMGTGIQAKNLSPDDFAGLDGCNEFLVETRPTLISELHAAHFEAGADIVITNSFGSTSLVLAEYGIGEKAYDLSRRSAELARAAADDFSEESWPRFVAGAIGPTTTLPSLGHISFDDLYAT